MSAQILDGRNLSARIRENLLYNIDTLRKKTGDVPALVNFAVGDSDGSTAYARAQERSAREIGIRYELICLPATTGQAEIVRRIRQSNDDPRVTGIMVHKPLPETIDYQSIANTIDPEKDVEGIHVDNLGQMLLGRPRIIPCTPAAVMEQIHASGVAVRGREAVIVGASEIVGKPLALLLLNEMATVTVCHIATAQAGQLQEHVGRADILVVAVGKAGLIPGEWVKPGAVVLDVGINKVAGRITGDVMFETACQRAAFITPVPGGIGPVTVMMLMRNGVHAYARQKGIPLLLDAVA